MLRSATLFAVVGSIASPSLHAQSDLACNGFDDVLYNGQQVQDFLVPSVNGAQIFFTLQGADGGQATITSGIIFPTMETRVGGEGAQAGIGCVIGTGTGQLEPGGTIRFIVGQRGDGETDTGFATAGGGGGTGLLYLPPGGVWATNGVILAAAGGGGGANVSSTTTGGNGFPGLAGECGGNFFTDPNDGGQGGCNGLGGEGRFGGGGGGALGAGLDPFNTGFAGAQGFPNGGAGGSSNNAGGWGFGGGGAGGGVSGGAGGGYSGGGAADGSSTSGDGPGRGGGSYVNPLYATPGSGTLQGFSPQSDDGFAQYVITSFIQNDQPQSPFPVFDGVPVSGAFCGAAGSLAFSCGPDIDGADLWYTFTNPSTCSAVDLTITVTSGDAEIQSYNTLTGIPSSAANCRGASVGGVYTDTLAVGETLRFRIQSPTGSDFTFVASTAFVSGQADCDANMIPDVCDIAANPSLDCDGNGVPDACDLAGGGQDCDNDGILDICEPSASCPPPNDLRVNAAPIVPGTYSYDTSFGTSDQAVICQGGFQLVNSDIWYSFTAQDNGQLIVTVDDERFGSATLTNIHIEDPISGAILMCDFNVYGNTLGVDGRVVHPMQAGENVLIYISAENVPNSDFSRGMLTVEFETDLIGDICETALTAEFPESGPTTTSFDLFNAQDSTTISPSCAGFGAVHDAWFKVTSPNGGPLRFAVDSDILILSLYDTCGGTELECSTNNPTGIFGQYVIPEIVRDMAPGETVFAHIRFSDGVFGIEGWEVTGALILDDPCANGPAAGCEFTQTCNGDGGNLLGCTNCPCNNNAPPGTIGGCLNSAGTSTALAATGDPSVSLPASDVTDLRFTLDGAPPTAFCVLLSGDALAPQNMGNPCFGLNTGTQAADRDGLRCAVQGTLRHGGRSADAMGSVTASSGPDRVWGGEATPNAGIAGQAGFAAGQTRYFQVTHREDALLVCQRGLNTSQAVGVVFTP